MKSRFSPLVERISHEGVDPWALHWEARQAAAAGKDVIVLSVGDPALDSPPAVVEAAISSLRGGDTHYTESAGRPALRAAIAARHSQRSGHVVTAQNVIVLNGAQNGLFVASLCLASAGDEVIAFDPMYATYPATIRASGADLVRVPTPAAKHFRADLAALEAALSPRTRAIFLATPNNPSGTVLTEREVVELSAIARRHGLWLVVDEVYAGLADNGRVPSLAAQLPEQVLTISSLSKTHAMPGWRAGWIVGPKDFIRHADDLAQCMLYGLSGFMQEAALTALSSAEATERTMREYYHRRRELFFGQLQGIAGIQACWPDAGMFMLIDVRARRHSSEDFVRELYAAEGVSLLDGAAFGHETRGFVRACYAVEEPVLRDAAQRIRRFCR